MVGALDSGMGGPGCPCRGHCVPFLSKILSSHSAFFLPGVSMATAKFNTGGNPTMD